jgi:hypothetical protein
METSIIALDNVITKIHSKKTRSLALIASFCNGFADGWYFCIPSFFREALDIKQTIRIIEGKKSLEWTQGASFNFSLGDTLYNHSYCYCKDFEECPPIGHPHICLSVETAFPSVPLPKGKGRNCGIVNFKILVKGSRNVSWQYAGFESLSQDNFIKYLIEGPQKEWLKKFE